MLQNAYHVVSLGVILVVFLILLSWVYALRRKNTHLEDTTEKRIRSLISTVNDGILAFCAIKPFPVLSVNAGFLELIGHTAASFQELDVKKCTDIMHPDDVACLQDTFLKSKVDGSASTLNLRLLHRNGQYIAATFRVIVASKEEKQPIVYCIFAEISEHQAFITSLYIEKERYRVVIEMSNDIIFEIDMQKKTLCCSPRFREKFGWKMHSSDITDALPYPLRVHPDDEALLRHTVEELLVNGEDVSSRMRIMLENGDCIWCRLRVTCIRHEGKVLKLIGKIEDIDELVRENLRLELLSQTDSLCGLYNKEALRVAAENSLRTALAAKDHAALFFIDSDNFKSVNDTLGHTVGDQVLKNIAASLRSIFRNNDIIGRFGGDEFCVFIPRMSREIAETKALEIVQHLRGVYSGEKGESVPVSASVGVACAPEAGTTYPELLANADKATYRAKALGRNRYVVYSPADPVFSSNAAEPGHTDK